jgi:hypothetical protein
LGKDRGGVSVRNLDSHELQEAIHQALAEVSRRLRSGELDQSGRFYTDEKLAAGAATGGAIERAKPNKANVA